MGGLEKDIKYGERRLLKTYGEEILNRAVEAFRAEGRHCTIEQLETKCKNIRDGKFKRTAGHRAD